MENESKGLLLYENEILTLLSLPEEQSGKILKALLAKRVGQVLPELDPMEKAVYTLVLGQIKCAEELSKKRRQSINKRWNAAKDKNDDTNIYPNTNTNTNTNTPSCAADAAEGEGESLKISESFEKFWKAYPKKLQNKTRLRSGRS